MYKIYDQFYDFFTPTFICEYGLRVRGQNIRIQHIISTDILNNIHQESLKSYMNMMF